MTKDLVKNETSSFCGFREWCSEATKRCGNKTFTWGKRSTKDCLLPAGDWDVSGSEEEHLLIIC